MVSLEKLTIGFIGIGKAGSFGSECIREIYKGPKNIMQYVKKIYAKNSDGSDTEINEGFSDTELKCKDETVEYGSVETMAKYCDIIVLGFEKSFGYNTGQNIKLDASFRKKLFNENKKVIHEIKDKLANFDGLIIDGVNPLEAMCYWTQKIVGLEKNQVIGFMPDTERFNEICEKRISDLFGGGTRLTEEEIHMIRKGFVLGEHSPNLVGVTSPIKIGRVHANSTNFNKFYKKIVEDTVNWVVKQMRTRKTTGPDVCTPFANLIERIYKQTNGLLTPKEEELVFVETHYINAPYILKQEAPQSYRAKIDGVCTGVPVSFKLVEKNGKLRIRSVLDKRYAVGEYDFDFDKISVFERELFMDCIRKTLLGAEDKDE